MSQGYQTGETSSDLANKRSINGAVERVTHASQNLLRSNNPLQLPLHWSDPWAASQRDWPEDSQSLMKSNTVRKNGGFKLPIIIAILKKCMQHVLIVKTELSHRDNQFNPIHFFQINSWKTVSGLF